MEVLRGRDLGVGVSIGCGEGSKEMALLAVGAVRHFHLFEIAEARVARGRKRARNLGLSGRISWHLESPDFASPMPVDLVYWNNALHHMLDTRVAVTWSRESLRPGGTFYMNDFVGPDRMQWPDEMLEAASAIREQLPERLIGSASRKVVRPRETRWPRSRWRRHVSLADPTECADSAAILPAIREHFPSASVKPTGGVVYHLALHGLLDRFTDDEELWPWLLEADRLYAERGLTHYAVAVA